jgi:predicted enzyme related to lactoylglutathione lyase
MRPLRKLVHSLLAVAVVAGTALGCASRGIDTGRPEGPREASTSIYYLEIVTRDVDAVCAVYSAANGLEFGEPDPGLGNARTARMRGGGLVGVRAPLRESEQPVVRPYWLVDDIESAVAAAVDAGAQLAHPPLEIPGHGTFAIYFEGDVEHGLWQL